MYGHVLVSNNRRVNSHLVYTNRRRSVAHPWPLISYSFVAESVCDVSKLNFNGNYECSDDMDRNVCTLSCPQGATLEPFKTARVEYACSYRTGEYEPKQIPRCEFGT